MEETGQCSEGESMIVSSDASIGDGSIPMVGYWAVRPSNRSKSSSCVDLRVVMLVSMSNGSAWGITPRGV
jgi:hypothetical protein